MHHDLYKGYFREDDFVLAYPFVPYQFKLIADVFDAFQSLQFVIKEVKNNERSVLGITHFTAKKLAEHEVGFIVPFDAFFNEQFNTNLTHRGRRAISAGKELPYLKTNPFAERVLNNLFMISNLTEAVRQTFPSTIENLTKLMMTDIDTNKLQLQNKVKEVLERLIDESIIREENNSFFFFNEDEMDVKLQIQNTHVNYEDRLDEMDKILRPILKVDSRVHFGQNDFRVAYQLDEKEILRNGDIKVKVMLMEKARAENKVFGNPNDMLLICVNEWFVEDETLKKEFEQFAKTEKYLRNNGDGSQGAREQTLNNFRGRNSTLRDKIIGKITTRFPETRFVSGQQLIDASEVNGAKATERYKNVVLKHLENFYKYHHLAEGYCENSADLKKKIPGLKAQLLTDNNLSPAENRVNDHITSMGNAMSVEDLIKVFSKEPYGWKDIQIVHILVMLQKKKVREFDYRGKSRYPMDEFVNKALITSERQVLIVKQGEAISAEVIELARTTYKDIFNAEAPVKTDGNELFEAMLDKAIALRGSVEEQAENYLKYPFRKVFHHFQTRLEELETIRDPKRFFDKLETDKEAIKAASDKCKQLDGFLERALPEYDKMKTFFDRNTENLEALPADNNEKIDWLTGFFVNEDPSADFRTARKTFDELKSALSQMLKALHETAEIAYVEVFDSLEQEVVTNKVDIACIASRSHNIDGIKKLQTISSLRLAIRDAGSFKSKQLENIIAEVTRKKGPDVVEERPVTYKPGGSSRFSIISNQNELDEYLAGLRVDMEKILSQNKKIIIE